MLRIETDPKADAVYIHLNDLPIAYTKELDDNRYIDYAHDGSPVGVSLLSVSDGVDVEDLPSEGKIRKALDGLELKILA